LLVLAYLAVDPPSHPLRGHRHLSQFRDRPGARAELFGAGAAHLPAGRAPRPAPCPPSAVEAALSHALATVAAVHAEPRPGTP
jgi:hypothetical protein